MDRFLDYPRLVTVGSGYALWTDSQTTKNIEVKVAERKGEHTGG